jgi:hypothetical protein
MCPWRTGFTIASNARKRWAFAAPVVADMRLVNSLCAIHEYEIAENSLVVRPQCLASLERY